MIPMREVRVSPDGQAVAIRTDNDDDREWGVMHAIHGGAWAPASVVEDWAALGS